jgi:hypothetical protein
VTLGAASVFTAGSLLAPVSLLGPVRLEWRAIIDP